MTTDRASGPPISSLSFEDALANLQDIVLQLESGTMTLDETMATFRRGTELAAHCQRLIAKAELRVSELSLLEDAVEPNGFADK